MAKMELEIRADLLEGLRLLAQRHYGDGGEASVGKVVEAAIEMRLSLLGEDGIEVEEPVSHWQFDDTPVNGSLPDAIIDWMFKGGGHSE